MTPDPIEFLGEVMSLNLGHQVPHRARDASQRASIFCLASTSYGLKSHFGAVLMLPTLKLLTMLSQ